MGRKAIDLTGKKYGELTVIKRDYSKKNPLFWFCQCSCGKIKSISGEHLKRGISKSCGCKIKKNLEGQKFGRWTVLKQNLDTNSKHMYSWICRCDCGNIGIVSTYSLLHKTSTSCGCYHKELCIKQNTTHKMSKKRIYRLYYNIRNRCCSLNNKRYKDYGGRGIKVCDEWLGEKGFENFYKWSLENNYADNLTIDRINNDGNYEPNNCRWVTKDVQYTNKRSSLFFELFGIRKTLKEWTNYMGWDYRKYHSRCYRGYTTFREKDLELIKNKLLKE